MAENKTQETDESVPLFLERFCSSEQKITDSLQLIKLMEEVSGYSAKMWGPSIIGFGKHHYRYASGHEGDMPLLAFSPRKTAISLYIFMENETQRQLLGKLGKYKMGKACIYINKLESIDINALKEMMHNTVSILKRAQ